MQRVPSSQAYPIRLIHWMIRRVQLLEMKKHTCQVSVIKIEDTKQVFLQIILPIMTKVIDMKHLQMITMMCVICATVSCTTQKVAYRERFEDAKGYTLYACIAHMNKFVDSTSFINKDYSGEYFVQLSSLSLEEIIRIKEYVDKECMNYWSISQNPEGNMIAYSSWKFYNSKDLDNFIHKTLRKNISNYER